MNYVATKLKINRYNQSDTLQMFGFNSLAIQGDDGLRFREKLRKRTFDLAQLSLLVLQQIQPDGH